MSGGRPSKLTPELVGKARDLAGDGLPVALIADRLDIGRRTAYTWIQNADKKGENSLEWEFRQAIFHADVQECRNLLSGLRQSAAQGNAWSATWLLTHHPRLRDHFSDAAAERRTERRTVATVMEAVAAVDLPADVEQALLLQMQARGLGVQSETES